MAAPLAICPFKMVAGMLLDGQRAKIHAVGEGKPAPINLTCIGLDCMAYVVTGKNDKGQPVGGCGLAVGPTFLGAVKDSVERTDGKLGALSYAVMEAIDEEVSPPSILATLARKIGHLFGPRPVPDDTPKEG